MEEFLDAKTQLLVAVSAATAAKCQKCFATMYGAADKVGVSDKEIRAAVAIAVKVAAKSDGFMAAFIEETTQGAVATGTKEGQGAGDCGCA